jgi:5-methylcytosine-specific restriction endonuclease McrA
MFNDNKYSHWYYQIIARAQNRALSNDTYTEVHHIIPRSLGGNNVKDTLVNLTGREHFICHWLLTKMVTGDSQKKMAYACKRMMHSKNANQDRYKISSRTYENLRIQLNSILKDRKFTAEWKEKLKQAARYRADNENLAAKEIRRKTMIAANQSRKGEKRLATTGEKNHMYGVRLTGGNNHFFGKKHTEETLAKLKVSKPKFQCQHCHSVIGGKSNYERWHGNNCKVLQGEILCQD